MKFLLIAGFADSVLSFRGALIQSLLDEGVEVHVAAPELQERSDVQSALIELGVHVHVISLRRGGTNPFSDLWTTIGLWRLMRRVSPEIVLGYTIKPVIYGSLAGWLARVPRRFALVTGLGQSFQQDGAKNILGSVVRFLYRIALGRTHKVFFQNPDDEALFSDQGIKPEYVPSCVVNGSGVDVSRYSVSPLPFQSHFLLIARLLGEKGIREYADAAKRIMARNRDVVFYLVGWIDENSDAIAQHEIDSWVEGGVLKFLGRLDDVRPAISRSSVFVLPTYYREGTPRTILEAMAMGRPIITTDAPGCRETVIEGQNGYLVPIKSVDALEKAMCRFIDDPTLAQQMGPESRRLAEQKYDVRKVNAVMLREMCIT